MGQEEIQTAGLFQINLLLYYLSFLPQAAPSYFLQQPPNLSSSTLSILLKASDTQALRILQNGIGGRFIFLTKSILAFRCSKKKGIYSQAHKLTLPFTGNQTNCNANKKKHS